MDKSLAQQLADYRPDPSISQLVKQTPILLLVGPTGAGKDSVKDKLLDTGRYHHIISHTTRPPRINHGVPEQDGREYHFINPSTASQLLKENKFIEAKVYSGNLYGTSVAEIEKARDEGKVAMTDLEVQGVAEYKAIDPNVMAVFLLPPNFETWQSRLQRRYGDVVDAKDYRLRLETALHEIEQLLNTNFYAAVVNDDLDAAVKRIEALVTSPEHETPDDPYAREVAHQLTKDIKHYLTSNP